MIPNGTPPDDRDFDDLERRVFDCGSPFGDFIAEATRYWDALLEAEDRRTLGLALSALDEETVKKVVLGRILEEGFRLRLARRFPEIRLARFEETPDGLGGEKP